MVQGLVKAGQLAWKAYKVYNQAKTAYDTVRTIRDAVKDKQGKSSK